MTYRIYKDGKPVSKDYDTRDQAAVAAFEMGAVVTVKHRKKMASGYEIVETAADITPSQLAACIFVKAMADHIDGGTRETEKRVAAVVRERFFDGPAAEAAIKAARAAG